MSNALGLSAGQMAHVVATYGYVTFWRGAARARAATRAYPRAAPAHLASPPRIVSSAGVILYNKWILTVWGFHFPITLTMWHMGFCSVVAFALVRVLARGARRERRAGAGRAHGLCAAPTAACLAPHAAPRFAPARWRTWP